MADQMRWIYRMAHQLEAQGWRWRIGGKHAVFYPADRTKRSFTVSITPSDRYARANAIRDMRKAGADIKP